MKKIIWFLLAIIILLTLRPLFHEGLFDVHDPTSAFRISTLASTLASGQFPASWNNSLNFGFGYPLHLYYAPLFSYLGVIFTPFVSAEIAVKIAIAISSFVATFGVYFLLARYGQYAATLGAIAFTYLPYRASALYVRGSYSEFLAMSLLPWVIYLWQKPQNNLKIISLTGLVTALFVLSHNTLPILLVPILILLIILYQLRFIKGSLGSLLVTFGLSAWFVLPVFFERGLVQVEGVARLTSFSDHFLYLSQLWSSPWGYGGSGVGIQNDHMTFMIGKGQLILALLGILVMMWHKKWKTLILYLSIVTLYIFLSLDLSAFVWQTVPMFPLIQFPWRTLSMIGVGVAALVGIFLAFIPKSLQLISAVILSFLLITTNLRYFRPQDYRTYSSNTLTSPTILAPLVRDKIPEYLPRWMPSFPGEGVDDGFVRTATSVSGTIVLSDDRPLNIATAYMPHWQLSVNGSKTPIMPDSNGLITTVQELGPGSQHISLTWHRTTLENLGLAITVLTIIVVIGLGLL